MTTTQDALCIDLRSYAGQERYSRLFSAFRDLAPGETLEVIADRDAQALYERFQLEQAAPFTWTAAPSDAASTSVRITKLPAQKSEGRCCGSCGGG